MVSQKEKLICEKFQFFDKHGKLPNEKVRVDVTLSMKSLQKIKGMNRSQVIDGLILQMPTQKVI